MLVDWQIKELCRKGLIQPFEEYLINTSSLDIRLGSCILIDDSGGFKEHDISSSTPESPFLLPPNGFILAATYEYFTVLDDISLELKLKSSRAREGLSHALAGHVESGFSGCLTLELKNYSQFNSVPLYYKQRIGQAIIYQTEYPDKKYKNTEYSYNSNPVLSRNSIDLRTI